MTAGAGAASDLAPYPLSVRGWPVGRWSSARLAGARLAGARLAGAGRL